MKASKKIRIKNYLIQRAGKGAGRAAAFTVLLFLAVAVPSNILNGSNAEVATTGGQFSSLIQSNAEQTSSYVWKKLGGPHGGIGYDIRMRPDNPDIMYVTDAWAGLHKSEDGGQTWFPANTGIDARTGPSGDAIPVFSVTVDPHNPDVLWSGLTGQRGVYKSTDGGETWSLKVNGIREQGITFRGFTVDPHDPDIVYAAGEISSGEWAGREQMGVMFDRTKGKVYRTTNGGDSWTAIWSGDNLARYVWIDPRDSDVIYVSTGIFDREAANTDVAAGEPGGVGIVKSTNGGKTWTVLNENNGLTGLYVGSLFLHPENPDILLAGAGHDYWSGGDRPADAGVFLSIDAGDTWEKVLDDDNIMSVEFATADPSIVYAAGPRNFYRSEDGGYTWRRLGGHDFWGPPGIIAAFPIDFQVDPRDPNRLFVNNYQGGNLLSTDGGESWTTASKGYSGAQISGGIVVDPDNPARVYVGALSGMFRSDDGGETWEGLSFAPARFNQINAVTVSPDDFDLVIKSPWDMGGQLPRSEDGGQSWEVVEVGSGKIPTFVDISFAPSDPKTVYAAVGRVQCKTDTFRCEEGVPGGGVYVSHDAGKSWQSATDAKIKDQSLLALAVHPQDSRIVYAGTTNSGIYKTTDGGKSWGPINSGLRSRFVRSLAIDPQDPEVIYLGTGDGELYRSEDGGKNWKWSSAGMNPGESITAIAVDPAQPSVVYAGSIASGVYLSQDSGETWRQINEGLETRAILTLGVSSDGGVVYAGTQGGGVFRLGEIPPEALERAKTSAVAPSPVPQPTPPETEPEPEPTVESPPVGPQPGKNIQESEPEQEKNILPAETRPEPFLQPAPPATEKKSNNLSWLYGGVALLICLAGLGVWLLHSRRKTTG